MFCERILTERDGVKSMIRMIDQVTHTVIGPDSPDALEGFNYALWLFVSLKAGSAQGRSDYTIRMEAPSGLQTVTARGSANFPGAPNQGVDLQANMRLQFDQEGIYWFDFELDGRVLTRMPLQVIYQRIMPGTTPAGPPPAAE
jgi:hypothetical protein